jgi:uncharacterized protein YciI
MPLFVLTCLDKPNALAQRVAGREAHLAHLAAQGEAIRLAGPFLDADGNMCGSMIVLDAPDLAAAQAVAAADPFATGGVFERVEVRPFRVSLGAL